MLTLYNTKLKPEQNARYESLDDYLATCNSATFNDFQYIKPALTNYIKVPMSGYSKGTIYNYVKYDDNRGNTFYYFITGHKWIAEETLGLTLTLDTINTFWNNLYLLINDNSHIKRCYKDRFYTYTSGGVQSIKFMAPKIDKFTEDLSNPVLIRKSVETIGDTHQWYLVYKTDYLASNDNLSSNPVSTYMLSDSELTIEGSTPTTIYPENISGDNRAYAIPLSTTSTTIKCHFLNGKSTGYDLYYGAEYDYGYYYYDNGKIRFKMHCTGSTSNLNLECAYLELISVETVYKQPDDFIKAKDDDIYYVNSEISLGEPITYDSYSESTTIPSFNTWYNNNKTDNTLVKIVCLPYCPFKYENYKFNDDYLGTANGIKIINPNIKFNETELNDAVELPTFRVKETVSTESPYDLQYESKRYNSSYYSIKYIYDNNYIAYKLEDFNDEWHNLKFNIKFVYNTEMSNSLLFRFNSSVNYRYDTDYGEYMLCNKTLDIPYYTNEYLNYLRYGKAVDERNAAFSTASTVVGGISTTLGSVGTLAALGGAGPLGWAVAAAGAAVTAVSFVSTLSKTRDSINQKIDNYTHQASNISSASDLSVFTEYSGNKLLKLTYEAPDELLTPILNYFRIYGYSTDEYSKPSINTRYWSDFIQADLDITSSTIDSDYIDDFKARWSSGLRIYHYHDGYDINMIYENWEVNLIE